MSKINLGVALTLGLATASCAAHTREPAEDTGRVDAAGGRAEICTRSVAGGDDARAALALQLEEFPSLRGLVFRRGPWTLRSVGDLEAGLADGVSAGESLAVTLVGQAFAGCTDAGLLGRATASTCVKTPELVA
jgi:hypothetical protein